MLETVRRSPEAAGQEVSDPRRSAERYSLCRLPRRVELVTAPGLTDCQAVRRHVSRQGVGLVSREPLTVASVLARAWLRFTGPALGDHPLAAGTGERGDESPVR